MGLRDRLRQLKSGSSTKALGNIELQAGCRSFNLIKPAQVTQQSLEVWRALPDEIRADPSMASFQMENDRLHGAGVSTPNINEPTVQSIRELELADEESVDLNDFDKSKSTMHENKSTDDECTRYDTETLDEGNNQTLNLSMRLQQKRRNKEQQQREKLWKRTALLIFWLFTTAILLIFDEKHLLEKTLEVPVKVGKFFTLHNKPTGDFQLKIVGAFNQSINLVSETIYSKWLRIQPQMSVYDTENGTHDVQNILHVWQLPIESDSNILIDHTTAVARNLTYKMTSDLLLAFKRTDTKFGLHISTNLVNEFAIVLSYNPLIVDIKLGSILAAIILLTFYVLIVWEVFERPFIAMICSLFAVAVLACFNDRPNMAEIVQWMDMELLTLLFCMMIIVLILTETGVFDYIAVFCFEMSGGKIWSLIYSLCIITCLISSVLDNMSTVLLLTPVALRLCEVTQLDPVPVIMSIIVHANIGGALTPIGDPISIIISANHFVAANGITFMNFVEHTCIGVVLTVTWSCIYMRLIYRDIKTLRLKESNEIQNLRREIKVWQRACNGISSLSKDAEIVRDSLKNKVKLLKRELRRLQNEVGSVDAYEHTLEDLKNKYPIKNKKLLIQAAMALTFVIVCFFVQSVPNLRTLPLGWVALLGVILLVIIMDRDDMEHLLHRIEWTTLLFLAAMFVMMECVERLGLFACINEITEHIILTVHEKNRLAMAIFIILWISALASAILDSMPVTVMMVKLVISLVEKESLGLPLPPLIWALVFGPSLGGNGTLYGASSNVIAAGIAEQHGYKISFTRYLRTIFPMMLGQLVLITVYLMISHILFEWH